MAGTRPNRDIRGRRINAGERTFPGRGAKENPTPHMGLLGMRERVTELGGTFRVVTRPLDGFRIEVSLPQGAQS